MFFSAAGLHGGSMSDLVQVSWIKFPPQELTSALVGEISMPKAICLEFFFVVLLHEAAGVQTHASAAARIDTHSSIIYM